MKKENYEKIINKLKGCKAPKISIVTKDGFSIADKFEIDEAGG